MENRPLTSIRGIAALWVVAHHITPASSSDTQLLHLGFTAVDLFFILSGIILASVYHDMKLGSTGKFWLKRVCRIYPAHLVALLFLTLVYTWPSGISGLESAASNPGYLASVTLLQPYVTSDAISNPAAWSAGIELSCYVLFPLAILCVRSVKPLGLASLSLLAALTYIEWQVGLNFAGNLHGLPALSRGLSGFGLGMVIWRVTSGLSMSTAAATAVELLGLAGTAYALTVARPDLLPLGFAVLLFGLTFDAGLIARGLRAQWLVWLGSISFSIYLLHVPVMLLVEKYLPRHREFTLEEPVRLLAILVLTLSASEVSYRFIEGPGRRLPALLGARRSTNLSPRRGRLVPRENL